jgi:uncharacterized protein (DUF4415 family)
MQFLVDMVIKMKQQATSKPFFSQADIIAAMEAATFAVADSDNPETQPDDWQNAIVSRSMTELTQQLAARRVRGLQKKPTKKATTIRFDEDVLLELKATGAGWQTRVNDAMREWIKTHKNDSFAH